MRVRAPQRTQGSLLACPPGVDDVGDADCACSRLGADELGAEDACEQDHGRIRFCRVVQ